MGQIQLTIALVMIGLFSIAIMGFAVNFAIDNNTAISLADDPELNSLQAQINSNLSEFRGDSQETYESIIDSSIEGGETTTKGGQFAITPLSVLSTFTNIFQVGYIKIFGSGAGFGIFLTTSVALIGFIMILYIWKTWRGLPD